MCGVMRGIYIDYIINEVCNVVGIFVQGHVPVMWNVCIPVLLITLLIAVISYEA